MKTKSVFAAVSTCVFSLGMVSSTDAALFDRGGGLIYDDELDITWLQDANYAATQYAESGGLYGDADGIMYWDDANAWAEGLSYYDSVRGVTYDDWRMPITIESDTAANEMGHLYYMDGVTSSTPGLFFNMGNDNYWSSELVSSPSQAWNFRFQTGSLLQRGKDSYLFVWAVRPGDVSAVPVPAAMWLFGSGLLGLLALAKRKAHAC